MYQLGSIRFEGLRGFEALRKTREAVYAEIPLLDGKPRLQRTGTALQSITVGIRLMAAFTTPAEDIAALDAFRETGEVLPLVSGTGEVLGDFVIVSIDETVEETSPSGVLLHATVSLTLKEHYDPNKPATMAAAAVSAAFAVGADKVVPVRLVRTQTLPIAVVSQSVTSGTSASKAAIASVKTAAANPPQQQSLFDKAKAALATATTAYTKAKDTVNAAQNLAAKAPQLVEKIDAVLVNIAAVRAAVSNGDITNALTGSDALDDSLGAVGTAVRPLNQNIILRQPQ